MEDKKYTPTEALKIRNQIEDRKDRIRIASTPQLTNPIIDASEGYKHKDVIPPLLTGADMQNRNALKGGLSTSRVIPLPKSRFGR